VTVEKGFNQNGFRKRVNGKQVLVIEGLKDSGGTLETTFDMIDKAGAEKSIAAVLLNKVGKVTDQQIPKTMERLVIVGAEIPAYIWEVGDGPDSLKGYGRDLPGAYAHIEEPAASQAIKRFSLS